MSSTPSTENLGSLGFAVLLAATADGGSGSGGSGGSGDSVVPIFAAPSASTYVAPALCVWALRSRDLAPVVPLCELSMRLACGYATAGFVLC